MVGMNAGDFPRESRPLGFDLMAARPRPGDRNRRDDDKYLFLEALLSARQRLYISYVGQGVCDNAAMPPSVLVSELIDALQRGYGIDPGELVVRHRLQAFSPRYFSPEGRLFSYSPENLGGAEALTGNKRLRPFLDDALPMEAAERDRWQVLDLSALCAFFSHPVRFLLQQRLGVFLEAEAEGPEDREAFFIDGLLAYRIGQELVQDALGGAPPMRRLPLERGRGRLPHGSPGEVGFRRLGLEARRFAEKIRRLDMGNGLPPAGVRLEIGGVSLRGALADLYPGGIRRFRYGRMRPVDLLDGWIRHLVLCAVRPPSAETATALYFRDKAWRFSPVQEAQALLEELLGLYQSGLRRPLRFFPVTSEAYARARFAGAAPPTAMARARRRWADDFRPGESDDPYIRLGFRDQEPLDEAFCTLAESVWTPLLSCGGPLSW
jgi:exodeoxyribonuclease V gamma subunit